MRRQSTSFFCGIASVSNALECLGIKRTQREIARLCAVTPADGADETEVKRALLACKANVDEWSCLDEQSSLSWLYAHVIAVGPAILVVDNDEHWLTAIGVCGPDKFILFDPSRSQVAGVEVHDDISLVARWKNSDGVLYGLGVSK